jgi:hypothetical protein
MRIVNLNDWDMTQKSNTPHGRPLRIQAQQQHMAMQQY